MFFLDLFSGAGGLAEGFIREGFMPLAHVEMDTDAINTLHTRLAYHYLFTNGKFQYYVDYLENKIDRVNLYDLLPEKLNESLINEVLSETTLDEICKKIENSMKVNNCNSIDVLIGGPPCQTFSIIGRNSKKFEDKKDQRNNLYKIYAELLGRFKPKCFVFENVPGLQSIKKGEVYDNLLKLIEEKGYYVYPQILDASDFGVLQKRKRLIITGWSKELPFKDITYSKTNLNSVIVSDLFRDLSKINPGEEKNIYSHDPSEYLLSSGIRANSAIPLTQHICRYQNSNDREIYRIAAELWNKERKRLIYNELPEILKTRSYSESFTDKYKVVAGDEQYSHTIIAHIAKDGHYYIHPDYNQARSITVREAARIQSFSDDYYFEGSRLKKFTQIGNAVPPIMAMQIAKEIKIMLNKFV